MKPNGEPRRISHPSPELKTLQYWCAENIFARCPVSDAAYAYRKGVSIKKHAEIHSRSKFILHMDIKHFFESINGEHIKHLLTANRTAFDGYPYQILEACNTINRICLRNNRMCIGAVSSPIISNAILFDFDKSIIEFSKNRGLKYSRYADDMYISSSAFIDSGIVDFFEQQLQMLHFSLNRHKTRFMSAKGRRMVTGLIITNDNKVSVGLKMRNKIKDMVYKKIVKGEGDANVIMGYLSFLKDVEPLAYNRIIIKYSAFGNVIEKIMS